jgi:hypothetical protein
MAPSHASIFSASRTVAGRPGRDGSRCCARRCPGGGRRSCRMVRAELRRRLHDPIPAQGAYLRSVLVGHTRYHGVPRTGPEPAGVPQRTLGFHPHR